MTRTLPGLVALALLAAPAIGANPITVPPLPLGSVAAPPVLEAPKPDDGKGKDEKDVPKEKDPEAEAEAGRVPPILFPQMPYPPAAPVVVDPRSGAWEQVRTFGGHVVVGQHHPAVLPAPVPAPEATPMPTPPALKQEPTEPVRSAGRWRLIPTSHAVAPAPMPVPASTPLAAPPAVPTSQPEPSDAAGRWRVIRPYALQSGYSPISLPRPAGPVPSASDVQSSSSPRLR